MCRPLKFHLFRQSQILEWIRLLILNHIDHKPLNEHKPATSRQPKTNKPRSQNQAQIINQINPFDNLSNQPKIKTLHEKESDLFFISSNLCARSRGKKIMNWHFKEIRFACVSMRVINKINPVKLEVLLALWNKLKDIAKIWLRKKKKKRDKTRGG